MTIITISSTNFEVNIGVNKEQLIIDTLRILREQGYPISLDSMYLKLERTQTQVNALMTYVEANIFNGDKLLVN